MERRVVWEYEIVQTASRNPDRILEDVKKMGLEGWELICPIRYDLYFKRPSATEAAS